MLDATTIRPAARGAEWHGSWAPRDPDGIAAAAALPALHRLLLTTDGTVTPALATIAGEPVAVDTLGQRTVALAADDEDLELWAGGIVLERRVLLRGASSGTPLLYGASRIVTHRLPRPARDALLAGETAIGLVVREHEIETFRAPLTVGIGPASDDAAVYLGAGLVCRRTYAIRAQGRPLMIVHEELPAHGFGAVV